MWDSPTDLWPVHAVACCGYVLRTKRFTKQIVNVDVWFKYPDAATRRQRCRLMVHPTRTF
jgi:hypothetical protein